VLDEPEQRVGDDSVELLAGHVVEGDHAHPQPSGRLLVIRDPARGLTGHHHVLLGHGGADPHGVDEVGGQPGQRGDQSPATAPGQPLTILAVMDDRPPVRHEDEPAMGTLRPGHIACAHAVSHRRR
jgi:hypothetical protein